MKRFFSLAIAILLAFGTQGYAYAYPKPEKTDVIKAISSKPQNGAVSAEEMFITIMDVTAEGEQIPATYRFIDVKNPNVKKGTRLYRAYQKAIYLDLIPNDPSFTLDLNGIATQRKLVQLIEQMYGKKVNGEILINGHKLEITDKKVLHTSDLLAYAQGYLGASSATDGSATDNSYAIEKASNFAVLNDVYTRLMNEHVDHENFDQRKLLQGAMEGMAEATGDKFTSYFPPEAATEFNNDLNGEFEGIGAYVDMTQPGELYITSPLVGSPAEAAGIKGGDRIIKIGDEEVTKDMSLSDAIGKIKGPAGTKVTIVILRNGTNMTFEIERKHIHIDLVTYKKLDPNTSYVQITSFGDGADVAFSGAISKMAQDGASKLILDLRNNGGGDLDQVSHMLDLFVPLGESKVNVIGNNFNEPYISIGNNAFLKDKKIVILINSGTASASEIMAGTIKDYYPTQAKLLGEKSYGKGSVQTYLPYSDGSSFKYTTAKWYTGKSSTGINHIGIKPDVELKFDQDAFKSGTDNQLEAARSLNF